MKKVLIVEDQRMPRENMERIRRVLKEAEKNCENGVITKEFVDTFIDKIYATPIDERTMKLDIKIFTGEKSEKYLEKLKKHAHPDYSSGHTFKKMIESYENSMK